MSNTQKTIFGITAEWGQAIAILFAALIGLWGLILQPIIERNATGHATQKALATDVRTILELLSRTQIPGHFILLFVNPKKKYPWADVARQEDYFSVFDGSIQNLGLLPDKEFAEKAVQFYTYLKASRDATSPLQRSAQAPLGEHPPGVKQGRNEGETRLIAWNVIEILARVYNAGQYALNQVVIEPSEKEFINYTKIMLEDFLEIKEKSTSVMELKASLEQREWFKKLKNSVEGNFFKEATAEEVAIKEASVEEATVEEATVEEATVKETTVKETTVEKKQR